MTARKHKCHYSLWTAQEIRLLSELAEKHSIMAIWRMHFLYRTYDAVYHRAWEMGITGSRREITVNGITESLKNWAHKSQVAESTIISRIKRGWPAERAVFERPVQSHKLHYYILDGIKDTVSGHSRRLGCSEGRMRKEIIRRGAVRCDD